MVNNRGHSSSAATDSSSRSDYYLEKIQEDGGLERSHIAPAKRGSFDSADSEIRSIMSSVAANPSDAESMSFSRTPGPKKGPPASDEVSWDQDIHISEPWDLQSLKLFSNLSINDDPLFNPSHQHLNSCSPDVSSIMRMISTPQSEKRELELSPPRAHERLPRLGEEEERRSEDVFQLSSAPLVSAYAQVNGDHLARHWSGNASSAVHISPKRQQSRYNGSSNGDDGDELEAEEARALPTRPQTALLQVDDAADCGSLRPKPSQEYIPTQTIRNKQRGQTHSSHGSNVAFSNDSLRSSRDSLSYSRDSDTSYSFGVEKDKSSSSLHNSFLSSGGTKPLPDLMESQESKQLFKEFSNSFRAKWRQSASEAEAFALKAVTSMPMHSRWRVYVELAELAKKTDDAEKVQHDYFTACLHYCTHLPQHHRLENTILTLASARVRRA